MITSKEIRRIAIVLLALLSFPSQHHIIVEAAMTMAQMEKTMETMRTVCSGKHNVADDVIDGLKKGQFDDTNKDLKCYTLCVAQMTGTLTKKNDLSQQKMTAQIEKLLPDEMKEHAMKSLMACKDVTANYKDACDRIFFATKCMYEVDPAKFVFP